MGRTGRDRKKSVIHFTVKGQVVIPLWLRKEFEIVEGTRAIIYQEGNAIVIKPMTAKHYRTLRGSLKGQDALSAVTAVDGEQED